MNRLAIRQLVPLVSLRLSNGWRLWRLWRLWSEEGIVQIHASTLPGARYRTSILVMSEYSSLEDDATGHYRCRRSILVEHGTPYSTVVASSNVGWALRWF